MSLFPFKKNQKGALLCDLKKRALSLWPILIVAILVFFIMVLSYWARKRTAPIPNAQESTERLIVQNPYQGLFQCHSISKISKNYLKGGGIIMKWSDYQPENNNQLNQEKINNLVSTLSSLKNQGKKAYFHIATYVELQQGSNLNDSLPAWTNVYDQDSNNDTIEVIKIQRGIYPAPWGEKYQKKLKKFLVLLYKALEERQLLDTIEYIEPSAGGIWGSTHLWLSDNDLNKFAQSAGCNNKDWACLGEEYTKGVNKIAGIYLSAFPNKQIMIVGGDAGHPEANYRGHTQLVNQYGLRVMFKGAGLGSADKSCGLRFNFRDHSHSYFQGCQGPLAKTKCGQEPWLSSLNGAFDPANDCGRDYQGVYELSLKYEPISYYCFYSDDIDRNNTTNLFVAQRFASQIKLLNYDFAIEGNNITLNLDWKNEGRLPLIAPIKEGEKWTAGSYRLFLELEKNKKIVLYQEAEISPPTNSWQPENFLYTTEQQATFALPSNLNGHYNIYIGLTDPNGEKERFALINSESNNDIIKKRYLVASNVEIRTLPTTPTPQPTPTPTPTPIPTATPQPTATPTPIAPTSTPSSSPSPTSPLCQPSNGDINNDGKIDIFDYSLLIINYGKQGEPGQVTGDLDCNGKVDIFDFSTLIVHYGEET